MTWRYALIASIIVDQGPSSHRYVRRSPTGSLKNKCRLLPQRSQSTSHSTSSHRAQNCCTTTRLGMCASPCPSTAYIGWTQSRKKRTVPFPHSQAKRPLDVLAQMHYLTSVYKFHRIVCFIRAYRFSWALHISHSIFCVHKQNFSSRFSTCGLRNMLFS